MATIETMDGDEVEDMNPEDVALIYVGLSEAYSLIGVAMETLDECITECETVAGDHEQDLPIHWRNFNLCFLNRQFHTLSARYLRDTANEVLGNYHQATCILDSPDCVIIPCWDVPGGGSSPGISRLGYSCEIRLRSQYLNMDFDINSDVGSPLDTVQQGVRGGIIIHEAMECVIPIEERAPVFEDGRIIVGLESSIPVLNPSNYENFPLLIQYNFRLGETQYRHLRRSGP